MQLENLLERVNKPARYVGGEYNSVVKRGAKGTFCLCFPDVYEVAISNLGNKIIYHQVNETSDYACERAYAPWTDMAKEMRENDFPLYSLETKTPLRDFDAVGFSLSYEMSYTNVLLMLDLAKIPLKSADRTNEPIVIAGGVCTVNPEPLADFIDCFILGEGEVNIIPTLDTICECKKAGLSRKQTLEKLNELDYAYVPSLSEELYDENGKYLGISEKKIVKKAFVQDFENAFFPTKQIVPLIEAVHDRGVLELFRGCKRGCRFCQAAFCYRPVRARSEKKQLELAKELLDNTGFDEMSLSSLSTSDYSDLIPLAKGLKAMTQEKRVKLSLPSLRLDKFESDIVEDIKKSTLTFAPEAGTQRLRDVINKNITEEDFTSAMEQAFLGGCRSVKLYFMCGLPTETDEDLQGIFDLAMRVKGIYRSVVHRKDVLVSCSVANFVPKPFTPFMWVKQDSVEELDRKHKLLRDLFYKSGINLNYHDSFISKLEGVFALSGRRTGDLLLAAYKNGCCFDGWGEQFNHEMWKKSVEECNVDMDRLTSGFDTSDALYWDFIDVGVSKKYFEKEYERAKRGETTPDCLTNCLNCGANKVGVCEKC